MGKDFKPVYVQGTKTGKGVIEVLEALGGINIYDYAGAGDECIYFIMPDTNHICMTSYDAKFGQYITAIGKEIEPLKPLRWRAERGGTYYSISSSMNIVESIDCRDNFDNGRYECGNYFKNREEVQEMAEKIKKVLLPD